MMQYVSMYCGPMYDFFLLFSYKDLDKIEASTDTTIMHDFLKL